MSPAYALTPEEARDYIKGSEPWPLRDVVSRLVGDTKILEVGCANGIQAARCDPEGYTGIDWSPSLLAEARKRLPEHLFFEDNALSLGFVGNSFNVAFAISLLEHLESADEARQCIAEMLRVAPRVVIGWHTPPTDEPTICRWVTGHFERRCWSNIYRTSDIVDPARVTVHAVPATDGSSVWEIV